MKRILTLIALAAAVSAYAQNPVSNPTLTHDGDNMVVTMDLDLSKIAPKGSVSLIPVLFKGDYSETLSPVGVYGRNLYYSLARQERKEPPFEDAGMQYLLKDAPKTLPYSCTIPYADWMDGASLRVDTETVKCCGRGSDLAQGEPIAKFEDPMPKLIEYTPVFLHVRPEAEAVVKERSVSGEAYVIFPSGKTAVDPKFKSNKSELDKIRATIDSVRIDPDIQITGIALKGYSSPEGKYASNEKLSIARTESIKQYVSGLFDSIDENVFKAEAVAENWDGLRAAIEASDYANKAKLIEVIDSNLAPDKKEARLKSKFAKDWKKMSADIFPLLRRTDYKVGFTVRSYTTPEEIRQVMKTKPQNLSINEFFLAAQGYEPGTPEFNEVFGIAAAVYPNDPVANLNAANAAMGLGLYERAANYLERAGESPKARYTRGVLAALTENFDEALSQFNSAAKSGVKEAKQAAELVKSIIDQRAELAAKGKWPLKK